MKKTILSLTILLSLSYGCDNTTKESTDSVQNKKAQDTVPSKEHSHSESDIQLNNGAKWKVNPEMLKYIRIAEASLNDFSMKPHSEIADFSNLAASLQKNIDLLTSNCTMEGPAHDELHKWLLPYIDMVDKLNNSKETAEATAIFAEIKSSYNTFNSYFE